MDEWEESAWKRLEGDWLQEHEKAQLGILPDDDYDDDYIESLTWMMAIEQKLGPYEDPDEFVCRRDPESLVDSAQCANCPLNTNCFAIIQADILDAERRLVDDA